ASECGGISFDRHGSAAERGTVGTPVEGVQLEWLDCEGPRHGNLAVRSAAVARGYHPRGTARLDGGRFITGDLARLDGGEVVLEGRVHDLINLRGRKVNPCEVEAVLRSHPAVEDAVVVRIDGGATG